MTRSVQVDATAQVRVSIVIPVYNNAEHFSECLESVLAQTYKNWDCTIVNNCSTDGSAETARRYAAIDPRIRVIDNEKYLKVVANHNWALSQISVDSRYCKVVFADDWIFPNCLAEMVSVAEHNPSAALVGALWIFGTAAEVRGSGLPCGNALFSGREIGRRYFLDGLNVFGALHNILLRADVVRSHHPLLNESSLLSDREMCLHLMRTHDFAFVHQVLTFTRDRPGSLTDVSIRMNSYIPADLYEIITFGRDFVAETEYRRCLKRRYDLYYNFLALAAMRGHRDLQFWNFHRGKLAACGLTLSHKQMVLSALARIARAVIRPGETFKKLLRNNRGTVQGVGSTRPVPSTGAARASTASPPSSPSL
jgi:glycosyltransferase involved in cell wall biosynthesis